MTFPKSRPGYGDLAVIRSATSGTEWTVQVLYWGQTGSPYCQDVETAERRWFPVNWVHELVPGDGPPPCSCEAPPRPGAPLLSDDAVIVHALCPEHGNSEAIRAAAQRGDFLQ